ncbi:MAG: hypothetical protein JWP52_2105, partial [Rhizobacter sp.]|nr:hypothetical protein [Rhizobacter sp.]
GPALSERILTERKTGDFKDWSDLQSRVKGVGDKTAAKYSTQGLTVNGTAFAGAPAAAEAANGMSKKAADKAAKDMSKDVKK